MTIQPTPPPFVLALPAVITLSDSSAHPARCRLGLLAGLQAPMEYTHVEEAGEAAPSHTATDNPQSPIRARELDSQLGVWVIFGGLYVFRLLAQETEHSQKY